ncbi:hypothetical protein K505DRAFT_329705 [Melanomma pulvis-pyrius CBS 109.77]|uniref:Uncharacterized protein n=1 Tax=Melanomma pulvis-pyrius CBS 109.77 TaxID=1314802 RepID=A0A6A6WTG4_9PLEO|nr:hypothetical protein K505DRAFT_329705 [Melanomma pulvis-pyrius CBS 109.77]
MPNSTLPCASLTSVYHTFTPPPGTHSWCALNFRKPGLGFGRAATMLQRCCHTDRLVMDGDCLLYATMPGGKDYFSAFDCIVAWHMGIEYEDGDAGKGACAGTIPWSGSELNGGGRARGGFARGSLGVVVWVVWIWGLGVLMAGGL